MKLRLSQVVRIGFIAVTGSMLFLTVGCRTNNKRTETPVEQQSLPKVDGYSFQTIGQNVVSQDFYISQQFLLGFQAGVKKRAGSNDELSKYLEWVKKVSLDPDEPAWKCLRNAISSGGTRYLFEFVTNNGHVSGDMILRNGNIVYGGPGDIKFSETVGHSTRCYRDEAALFRVDHPDEARYYRIIEPYPLDFSVFLHRLELDELRKMLKGVEQRRYDKIGLEDFIRQMRTHYSDESIFTTVPRRISEALSQGGHIFFFMYSKRDYCDQGLVVLRDEKVIYRFPKL